MSNWTEMFDKKGGVDTLERSAADRESEPDIAPAPDPNEYHP